MGDQYSAMNSTIGSSTPSREAGKICRPAVWMDIVKFFVLNYGLHAFTILSRPGAGALVTIIDGITAIVLPFHGTASAIFKLFQFSIFKKDKLARALDAGALCMVVPSSSHFGSAVSSISYRYRRCKLTVLKEY
jgi:hypothetical protein